MKKALQKYNKQIICIAITAISLLLTFTIFRGAFSDLLASCKTFLKSLAVYFEFLFTGELPQTSAPIPSDVTTPSLPPLQNVLPPSVDVFKSDFVRFFDLLFTGSNFSSYSSFVANLLLYTCRLLPFVVVFWFLIRNYVRRIMTRQNNDYNKDSRQLKCAKWFGNRSYTLLKRYVINFAVYVKQSNYSRIWLLIWLFNFNVFSMLIIFVGLSLLFSITFNLSILYQFLYGVVTLSVPMFRFVPWLVWVILALWLIDRWRKRMALDRLNHMENCNKGFILDRSISSMFVGSMGKGKTTLISDISLSTESIFRHKAYELLLETDLKFPNFPWIVFENALKYEIKKKRVFNLASCGEFATRAEKQFNRIVCKAEKRGMSHDSIMAKLSCSPMVFEYDFTKYGLYYDDKKTQIYLFDALRDYAKLYFIYVVTSSLIISNYAIRTDFQKEDIGNLPQWNLDFFKKDSRLIKANSRHSHILDFDMLRLGKKLVEDNPNADIFEFGCITITEIGKERGNQFKSQEIKDTVKQLRDTISQLERVKLDASAPRAELLQLTERATQLTDKFNDALKLIRHKCTVCGFPFARVFLDEQRPESLGADARDLCEIVHIKDKTDTRLTMPFFFIAELVYSFIFGRFKNTYNEYRFNRGDNTLLMFSLKKLSATIHRYYSRIYNRFGYHVRGLAVENGSTGELIKESKYYLMTKKIYSDRFATDAYYDIFARNLKGANRGIEDLPEYQTHKATEEELKKQNSYFMNEITKYGKEE